MGRERAGLLEVRPGGVRAVAALVIGAALASPAPGETKVLLDFERQEDLKAFEFKQGSGEIAAAHATSGRCALAVRNGEYMVAWRSPPAGDWSGYDVLRFDYFNDTGAPVAVSILVGDRAWRQKDGGTYWNRHNSTGMLAPGAGTFTLPVKGLYRGEAGSRNNDIRRNIDPDSIVRLDIGFTGREGRIYLDNLRLESASAPDWARAFDFGPPSQPLEPGFTAVTFDTAYSDERGFGFHPRRKPWGASAARDDTFPTPLLQDFVEVRDCEFQVALRDGPYHVWLVCDDCGYWGDEQARYSVRTVEAEGRVASRQERPLGWAHALYDFEDVEPLPGTDMWKTYMEKLFSPVEFDVEVTGGRLELAFSADREWSWKLAALVVYPAARRAEGRAFVEKVWAEQRKTFATNAVCLDEPAAPLDPELARLPALPFRVGPDEAVRPGAVPSKERVLSEIRISAAQGEHEPAVFGLRAAVDMRDVTVRLDGLAGGPGAAIPPERILPQVAWYVARRGFNSTSYRFETHTLRPARGFAVPAGVARLVWVDVSVPETAAPGEYSGRVVVDYTARGSAKRLELPVKLTVWPFKLREADFARGFYGIEPPRLLPEAQRAELQRGILRILRDHRMNSFSGGPDVVLKGFRNGEPVLDFSEADRFMELARSHGFSGPYMNYGGGGIAGLFEPHGYVKGRTGERLERETGLPYEEVCRRVLEAYRAHAEEKRYLPVILGLVDETRVAEHAREQLELQKTLRKAAPWLAIGGSYSVSFAGPADELHRLLREMFATLRVNVLNVHDRSALEAAGRLGNELWIYNQGQSRYSFGFYQWSECAKGVKGRMEWHLFPLHGWQYFDLDGREPDTGVIAYHSKLGILPTVQLARAREGVEDMLYCQTLASFAAENPNHPAAAGARALLERLDSGIRLGERAQPGWLDIEDMRARLAAAIVAFAGR